MTDKKLCERLKKGNHYALNEAIVRFTPYVSTVVWRVFSSSSATREDLEEVVSDTFLALWNHAAEINYEQLRPWLAAVAKNRAIDRLRSLSPSSPLPEDCFFTSSNLEDNAIQRDHAEHLWAAVNSLDEPERTLFIRHYYEGEKLKILAKELNMNLSTLKTKLHRGRKILKTRLEKEGIKP